MAKRFRIKKKINVGRVVTKVAGTIIALYAGGFVLTELGHTMVNTTSPFYKGLALIGWTVGSTTNGTSTCFNACQTGGAITCGLTTDPQPNCLTSTDGSGVLAVIGIIGIASIVMEFVELKM